VRSREELFLTSASVLGMLGAMAMGVSACGPSQERVEADRVITAINRLRDAPPEPLASREALLAELERVSATSPPAAKARDACARAYRLLIEGKRLTEKVAEQLADPKSLTLEVGRELALAESKITESAAAMPACETAVADLRRPGAAGR
jgi:hypothetical protein